MQYSRLTFSTAENRAWNPATHRRPETRHTAKVVTERGIYTVYSARCTVHCIQDTAYNTVYTVHCICAVLCCAVSLQGSLLMFGNKKHSWQWHRRSDGSLCTCAEIISDTGQQTTSKRGEMRPIVFTLVFSSFFTQMLRYSEPVSSYQGQGMRQKLLPSLSALKAQHLRPRHGHGRERHRSHTCREELRKFLDTVACDTAVYS